MLDELNAVRGDFRVRGARVERALAAAALAVRQPRPRGAGPAGRDVWADGLGGRIVRRCQRIALLYQPVAGDFREVTAALRTAPEWEWVGAAAAEIVERSADLTGCPVPDGLTDLAALVAVLVGRAWDAARAGDAGSVRPWARVRDEVAARAESLTEWLVGAMRGGPMSVRAGLALFAITETFRRVADRACHTAEEVALMTAARADESVEQDQRPHDTSAEAANREPVSR